jgi:hypothetical protein
MNSLDRLLSIIKDERMRKQLLVYYNIKTFLLDGLQYKFVRKTFSV